MGAFPAKYLALVPQSLSSGDLFESKNWGKVLLLEVPAVSGTAKLTARTQGLPSPGVRPCRASQRPFPNRL